MAHEFKNKLPLENLKNRLYNINFLTSARSFKGVVKAPGNVNVKLNKAHEIYKGIVLVSCCKNTLLD